MFFSSINYNRTNKANDATHYVKLGKRRRESSKRNYYIISPRVIIKAIITITTTPLAIQLQQKRIRMVHSSKEVRKRPTESNGTLAMDLKLETDHVRRYRDMCV